MLSDLREYGGRCRRTLAIILNEGATDYLPGKVSLNNAMSDQHINIANSPVAQRTRIEGAGMQKSTLAQVSTST